MHVARTPSGQEAVTTVFVTYSLLSSSPDRGKMTKALPWYKRFPEDFIAGTMGLTLEEKGAYSMVLDLIYANGGAITDNSQWIAHVCGCSVRKWNVIRRHLIAIDKLLVSGGKLSNMRCEMELYRSARTRDNLAIKGRSGGERRAENERLFKEFNGLQSQRLKLGLSDARAYFTSKIDSSLMESPMTTEKDGKRDEVATEPTVALSEAPTDDPIPVTEALLNSRLLKGRHPKQPLKLNGAEAQDITVTDSLLKTRLMQTH